MSPCWGTELWIRTGHFLTVYAVSGSKNYRWLLSVWAATVWRRWTPLCKSDWYNKSTFHQADADVRASSLSVVESLCLCVSSLVFVFVQVTWKWFVKCLFSLRVRPYERLLTGSLSQQRGREGTGAKEVWKWTLALATPVKSSSVLLVPMLKGSDWTLLMTNGMLTTKTSLTQYSWNKSEHATITMVVSVKGVTSDST